MGEAVEGAAGRHLGARAFGLSGLLIRLMDMTQEELRAADPRRAAKTFSVNVNHAAGYIIMEQQQRGVRPVLEWEPVAPPPPPPASDRQAALPPISDRQMVLAVTRWGPGDKCPHGVDYPGPCATCEDAVLRARGKTPNFHRRAPVKKLYDD